MIIVGVDVETNGLDSSVDQIVEMGATLFDTETKRVLASFGKIYKIDRWDEEAAKCHKIPQHLADRMISVLESKLDPWDIISGDLAKYVVAHKASHDYGFVTKVWPSFKNRPWICTHEDLQHHLVVGKIASGRLAHLCVDYQIQMGTWHQALADAEACARLASFHDLDAAFERKMLPKYRLITYGEFLDDIRDVMANAPSVLRDGKKYKWNQEEAPRAWMKDDLTIQELEEDAWYLKDVTNGKWKFEGEPLPPKPY